MAYGESIGHVTDDVTWPRKVKVVTQLYLGPNISTRAGDRSLVTIEHEYVMGYGETNGPVTDDVTWPRKIEVVTQLFLGPSVSKKAGDRGLVTMEHE